MNTLGIIITRHVRCETTNLIWNECYSCIRKWYPNNIVMIVDDASNYEYIKTDHNLTNCFVIQSEFPGAGELLGYYYFHKYHLFDKALVIHDSSFLNGKLQIDIDHIHTAIFIWHFSHEWNINEEDLKLMKVLNNIELLTNIYNDTNRWKGCFGTQSVITYTFLDIIVQKYNLFSMLQVIKTRNQRCNLERVFGLVCCAEDTAINHKPSIMGLIHDCEDFGTVNLERYKTHFNWYSHLAIIKTWVGR